MYKTLRKIVALLAVLCLLAGTVCALGEDKIVIYKGAMYSIDDFVGFATYERPLYSARNVTIPARIPVDGKQTIVYRIADRAFYNDEKLTSITIGRNVWHIGKCAFCGCKKLTTVKGGGALQWIEPKAFKDCKALTSITLGKDARTIDAQAFYGCEALKLITIKSTELDSWSVGKNAFKGVYRKAIFKCPKSRRKEYKALLLECGAPITAQFK